MHSSYRSAHTLTGLLHEIQRACVKDRGETILQSAATTATALNKDEGEKREDTHPLMGRTETEKWVRDFLLPCRGGAAHND